MEYFVRHRTTYRYLQDVSHSWHLAHLRPRVTPFQSVHDTSVMLSLETASRVVREDYFHNPCEWISIDQPHAHLEILAESRVTVDARPERASRDSLAWEEVRARLEEARIQLGYTIITAPISGTVASVSTYEGETVAADFTAP